MRKKRLLILRVNTILSEDKEKLIEDTRQRVIKQLKDKRTRDKVLATDMRCTIECIDYDSKELEVRVVHKDDQLVVEKKEI